jgi:hypothetical protein
MLPRLAAALAALVYALFAAGCFRLAVDYDDETALAIGEGAFTLLGAVALAAAAWRPRHRALVAFAGTVPLVGWFLATPSNSGPPFLVASLVVPAVACAAVAHRRLTN